MTGFLQIFDKKPLEKRTLVTYTKIDRTFNKQLEQLMGDKGQQTKEGILRAAVTLFAEKGFEGAGIRELAGRAGVPQSLLYYHFRNKEAILQELIEAVFREMEQVFREILDASRPGEWNYAGMALRLEELFRNRREEIRIVFSVALRSPELRQGLLGHLVDFQARNLKILESHGIKVHNREKMLMERFFFGFGPFFLFLFFREQWLELEHVTPENCSTLFRELMTEQVEHHARQGWK